MSLGSTAAQNTVGAGTDTLSNFENLLGTAFNDTLNGNGLDNLIEGGAGNDVMNASTGTDTLSYWNATAAVTVSLALTTAQVTGGAGTDTILNFENLLGSAFNDTLTGSTANNLIEGGAGNDIMNGGAGVDTASYSAATAAVTVSLALTAAQNTVGAGTDTLSAFENLAGSKFNDALTGSNAANIIEGGAGSDVINGGLGNDTLWGETGADFFLFNSVLGAANVDTIADFSITDDTIRLENTGTGLFNALTTTGTLAADAFYIGPAAHSTTDRIIYDMLTGKLFYDADGSGVTAAIQFATVAPALSLTNADFVVI